MSTYIFTSESVSEGHPDKVSDYIADSILDRLVHNAHRMNLAGESMRKGAAKRAGLDAKQDA